MEENLRDADRLLLLGRKDESVDSALLNTLETYLNDASSRWTQLEVDSKKWEEDLDAARTDFQALHVSQAFSFFFPCSTVKNLNLKVVFS